MSEDAATEGVLDLAAGQFRILQWPGTGERTAVFLHGLSGVADVWGDTISALGRDRPRCIAIDQRGHGRSPRTPGAYRAAAYLGDLVELIETLETPVDLVGHSMGARVAILAAARRPDLLRSVVIVDIGPEAWRANITTTARLFASLPERFASHAEALEVGRLAGRGDAWAHRFIAWRLHAEPDGTYTWLGDRDALIESVTTQRSRNYWADWERIALPALLIRGGDSKEVRPRIADTMRRRNTAVDFVEIPDVGHNIPLLAPQTLADELRRFWTGLDRTGVGT